MQKELERFIELGKVCPECGKKLSLVLVEDLESMGDDALQWRCYQNHDGESTSPRLVATLYCHRLTATNRSALIDIVKGRHQVDQATPFFEAELVEYDVRQQALNDAIWQLAKEYGVKLTDHATHNHSIDFVSLWKDVAAKMTERDLQTWLSIQPVAAKSESIDAKPRIPEVMHELLKNEFMSRHLSLFQLSIPQVFSKELTLDFVERAAELAVFTWGESEPGQRPRRPKLSLSTANSPERNTEAVLAAYNEWVDSLYAYAQKETTERV